MLTATLNSVGSSKAADEQFQGNRAMFGGNIPPEPTATNDLWRSDVKTSNIYRQSVLQYSTKHTIVKVDPNSSTESRRTHLSHSLGVMGASSLYTTVASAAAKRC